MRTAIEGGNYEDGWRGRQTANGDKDVWWGLPFTNLGLPMGTTRPTVTDLMPMVTAVQRKIPAAVSLLDYGSKLTLLNSVVTLLAIYAMCSVKLNPKIIEHLDKLRRYCLWRKN